jgi:CRP/FNR family transcriptional regulator, nitrogen fixation regulation protein
MQMTFRNTNAAKTLPETLRMPVPNGQHCLFGSVELNGAAMNFGRNAEIFGEGEDAEYVYKVLSGAARTYKVLNDGRRQIGAFYMPGDIFGLESADAHSCSAEAIGDSVVLVVRRSTLLRAAEQNHDIARQLWSLTAGELNRTQAHVLLLIKSAPQRLAAFLLEMADRLAAQGPVDLPMSRQDIADYLGLTIETVSRTLTQLAAAATIQLLASRRILLCNRSALSRLNG